MKIYVAGRTTDVPNVQLMQKMCIEAGHTITHDWTSGEGVTPERLAAAGKGEVYDEIPDEEKQRFAEKDFVGAALADVVIAMGSPGWWGTLIEIGIALACGHEVWLVGLIERNSVFWYLENVRRFASPYDVVEALK